MVHRVTTELRVKIKWDEARVIQSPTGDLVNCCFVRDESHGDAFI